MQKIVIEQRLAGQRFDKFLTKHLSGTGTGFIYKMLRKKNITLNGKKAEGKELLVAGDEVSFFFSDETYSKFTQTEQEEGFEEFQNAYQQLTGIDVVYEDEQILVLNKPAGILSQKAQKTDFSVNEWLIGYLLQEGKLSREEFASFHPSVCNRLDRNTSGLLLCGKTLIGSQELSRLIKERNIHKYYYLFVKGQMKDTYLLEGYLYKDEAHNRVSLSASQVPGSAYIKTACRPIQSNSSLTFLEVELFTGKPHQIRAHLAEIGHPLLGDYKYGNRSFNDEYKRKYGVGWQLLHAARLEFPVDCGALQALSQKVLTAPLPDSFIALMKGENIHGYLEFQRS